MIKRGDCYYIFLLLVNSVIFTTTLQPAQGACTCSVFQDNATKPIIEHTLQYNVKCDQEGICKCRQLCIALAHEASEKAPDMFCEKLNQHNIENLTVSVFVKVCNELWISTGLRISVPTSCHERKVAFDYSKINPYN